MPIVKKEEMPKNETKGRDTISLFIGAGLLIGSLFLVILALYNYSMIGK